MLEELLRATTELFEAEQVSAMSWAPLDGSRTSTEYGRTEEGRASERCTAGELTPAMSLSMLDFFWVSCFSFSARISRWSLMRVSIDHGRTSLGSITTSESTGAL